MVEYRNIAEINCRKDGELWDCDIIRFLTDEPKKVNNQLCFITKAESEKGLSDVHMKEKMKMCTIDDIGTARYLRCE